MNKRLYLRYFGVAPNVSRIDYGGRNVTNRRS